MEIHNAKLGITVRKAINDVNCQLKPLIAWCIRATNCLKNVNGIFPNQLVFRGNPNYPNSYENKLIQF